MFAWFLVLFFGLAVLPAFAQLPVSGLLSDTDWPLFRAEVVRVEKLLAVAPDKATATYLMARTWGSAKQWPETMQWLRRVAELKVGLDPSRDSIFADLRRTTEFGEVLAAVRAATPVVANSRPLFKIAEGDLVPESVAYDPRNKHFYFGSTKKGKVIRCSASGDCRQFAGGLGTVFGVKVHGSRLWLLNNSDQESALIQYDIPSGKAVRRYPVVGAGDNFNDLAITAAGDVI